MLQIGVIPLPALMKRERCGSGSGRRNSPSTSPRKTICPGCALRVNQGDISPSSTYLTVTETRPFGWSGSEVSEYARQWRIPFSSAPIRRYWPGL